MSPEDRARLREIVAARDLTRGEASELLAALDTAEVEIKGLRAQARHEADNAEEWRAQAEKAWSERDAAIERARTVRAEGLEEAAQRFSERAGRGGSDERSGIERSIWKKAAETARSFARQPAPGSPDQPSVPPVRAENPPIHPEPRCSRCGCLADRHGVGGPHRCRDCECQKYKSGKP